jgi:hypothetical protein
MTSGKLLTQATGQVAQLYPLWGSSRPTRFWAEHGLVNWIDECSGTTGAMGWREAADRVLGLSEMVFKSHETGHYTEETRKLQRFISEMEEVIRKAKEQKDPPVRRRRHIQPIPDLSW